MLEKNQDNGDRSLLVQLLILAVPTILQMASYTLMQFADTYMLSLVGDIEATAAGQAGAVHFSFLSFGFGILLLVNALVSQHIGAGKPGLSGRYLWQGMYVAIAYGLLTALLSFVALPMFLMLGHEPVLAKLEAEYFIVLAIAGGVKLMGTALTQFMIGVGKPFVVLVSAVIGCLINLFFNWLLIYGNWGFPELGVLGAALATAAAMVVELVILVGYVFTSRWVQSFSPKDFKLRTTEMFELLKMGTPVGFAMSAEVMAWTLFNVWVIATFGTDAMKGNNYAFRWMLTSFIPMIGIGSAVTALVGRQFGAGNRQNAIRVAHIGFAMAACYMLAWGVVFLFFGQSLMALFTDDANVIKVGTTILMFMGAYQILDAMYVVYSGALRGMGDTLVPSLVMIGLNWSLVVCGAWLIAIYFPQLGPGGPWTMLCFYGICVGAFMLHRVMRNASRLNPIAVVA